MIDKKRLGWMTRVLPSLAVCVIATLLMACTDRSAVDRKAREAQSERLTGAWDAHFHLERPLFGNLDSGLVERDVSGQLAFVANRSYPTTDTPSDYGAFDVDFRSFGFDVRSDKQTPTALVTWRGPDSLEIFLGDPGSDITVRMNGRLAGDSIKGQWRVLVARTGGGSGRFVLVRH